MNVHALLKESETDFAKDINAYLADLESSPVRTLKELITFNEDHAREELPPGQTSLFVHLIMIPNQHQVMATRIS